VPIRALHPTTRDFAEIVSGLLDLDPDDHEQWHVLFINLDQRVPRSPATHEVIAQLVRALDALAGDEEAEARRLMAAARANRGRVRRLREYVLARVTDAGLHRMDGAAYDRGSLPAAERADVREAARSRAQPLEPPGLLRRRCQHPRGGWR
jgi:hypothetical protein